MTSEVTEITQRSLTAGERGSRTGTVTRLNESEGVELVRHEGSEVGGTVWGWRGHENTFGVGERQIYEVLVGTGDLGDPFTRRR